MSHRAFALEANRLGLTSDEQRRLRQGLAAVGLRVKPPRRGQVNSCSAPAPDPEVRAALPPAKVSAPPTQTFAPSAPSAEPGPGGTAAARRLAQARRMLARYADADGTVSRLAHDGVVRLHGLTTGEARELTARFPITRPGTPRGGAEPVERRGVRSVAPASPTTFRSAPVQPSIGGTNALDAGLAEAVRAARAVLEEDRWRSDAATVVLKADEEVGLALLLRGGSGFLDRDVPEEEIATLPRDSERRRAYECLVLHNQRLVQKIAQGYQGRGLDIEDLVQHGSIGLLGAVRRFDASRGNKFSTYATSCIQHAINRAVAEEGPRVRLPADVRARIGKVTKAERELAREGRATTVDNVAYASGLTFAEVEEVRRITRPAGRARRRRPVVR
ncbi:sigma-70 family RNA polymerase sigma factor [Streptomyces antibioticus]|uniref:sigma-70 family RNA polymerase sigma factor n=1 Tax=Streptomyces antibioticus TaxID=1890 RepID=UPI0033DFB0B2